MKLRNNCLSFLFGLLLMVPVLVNLYPSQIVAAQDAETPSKLINLEVDANHDGMPDELVTAIMAIDATAQQVQSATADGALAPNVEQSIRSLISRLPYSDRTRSLQTKAADLQAQLNVAKNDTEIQSIVAELEQLENQLLEDPNYAITMRTMNTLFVERGIGRPTINAMSNQVFLPVISSSLSSDQQANASTENSLDKTKIETPINSSSIQAGPNYGFLQMGDMLFIRASFWSNWLSRFVYCMNYCHAGTYEGYNSVYESNFDGVRIKPLQNWKQRGAYVALAWNRWTTYAQDRASLAWAESKWGWTGSTPYNYNFADKWTDNALYCSQLVWKIHQHSGYDLDSNNWGYLTYIYARWGLVGYVIGYQAVAPDEVALSSNVYIYSQGYNP